VSAAIGFVVRPEVEIVPSRRARREATQPKARIRESAVGADKVHAFGKLVVVATDILVDLPNEQTIGWDPTIVEAGRCTAGVRSADI
jgi:hypothetical protein